MGIVLNFFLFVLSALAMFCLTFHIFQDIHFAVTASQLFCFNPASIFFSAMYSESMFCIFTFLGLVLLHRRETFSAIDCLMSSICFALAGATRSNGLLLVGFILHRILSEVIFKLQKKQLMFPSLLKMSLLAILCSLLCLAPYVFFQLYVYWKLCDFGDSLTALLKPDWCLQSLPFSYGHIQAKYWEVGFLRYYQWRKVPNFLLAAPILCLVLHGTGLFLKRQRDLLSILGLYSSSKESYSANQALFAYTVHCLFLACFSILFIHIEVSNFPSLVS